MAVILCYFTNFGDFGANYLKVVEVRPIQSATNMQPKESSLRQYMIGGNILSNCRVRVR